MRRLQRWLRRLANTPLVFVYAVIATFLIEEVLTALSQTLHMTVFLLALLALFLLSGAYLLLLELIRRLRPPQMIPIGDEPTSRRGLILLLGGHSHITAPRAIEHHRPTLERVWLLVTDRTEDIASTLRQQYCSELSVHQEEITHPFRPKDTADAVSRAISHAQVLGLSPSELICDVTGGTSAMTAGAILACLESKVDAEMVAGSYTEGTLEPEKPINVVDLNLHRT